MECAIVTGASSGVGAATVEKFRSRGVDVIGIDVAESSELVGHKEGRYDHLIGDAGEADTWAEAVARCDELYGGAPSIVVFNAARLVMGSVVSLEEQDWQDVFHVNVFGPARALKILIPAMAAAGGGSIVFVNSSVGLFAEQNLAAYCTSKGAGLQLMRSVAADHARQGIRANAVCPGAIETPFFMQHVDASPDPRDFLRSKSERHPSGVLMQPEQVASVVDFLASPMATGVTGVALPVDGGLTSVFDFYPDQARSEASVSEALMHHAGIRS